MAHPLFWPSKYYFYPIGNTSAVSLTTDLPIEEPAHILLLGCGDPRNVLYTIYTEPSSFGRALDFTCSDFEPAVLARNVLLLTMIADGQLGDAIWNTFFHFRLDKASHDVLINQCKKLVEVSETPQKWIASSYGSFIKMCTNYTLEELRRHWMLYVNMQDLPKSRLQAIHDAFNKQSKDNLDKYTITLMSARSLGPLLQEGWKVASESFSNFWKTGGTFTDRKNIVAATLLNPTFVYSQGGEGCSLHYGTDPLTPFQLAAFVANAKNTLSLKGLVQAAKDQFKDWCSSYHRSISSTHSTATVRFFVGEATAVCRALQAFNNTGTLDADVPVIQWKTPLIQLSEAEYTPGSAPSIFNAIHSSNLEDHIGLLNVLISSVPILSPEPFSVLYTESLLSLGQNATKSFTENLHADLSIIGLLIGFCPVDYLCGFNTRSNTHELLLHLIRGYKEQITQFQQVTKWKTPTSGDMIASRNTDNILTVTFDGRQLGTLIYDMYQSFFEKETARNFLKAHILDLPKALASSNLVHYTRETFALFLRLVRDKLQPTEEVWATVMDRVIALQLATWSIRAMETLSYQDFCGQLRRHGVYKAPCFDNKASKIGRFLGWKSIPDLVRIVLVVPRHSLAVLEQSKPEEIGTPPLLCEIFGTNCHNVFAAVHVAFGRTISVGTKACPQVTFEEDKKGWAGRSDLVTSFIAPAWLLSDLEPPEALNIGFCVQNTPAALFTLADKLGPNLHLFSAKLMDEALVHVLPADHSSSKSFSKLVPHKWQANMFSQIGESLTASVQLDEQCELAKSLTAKVSITDGESIRIFSSAGSKVVPQITQLSPCAMRVTLGSRIQDIAFPFPVIGSAHRLRLARKSQYIEVIVPLSSLLIPDGMKMNPYPVIGAKGLLQPWSIHRVNLSTLPILDAEAQKVEKWLNPHVGSMMTARERSLREKNDKSDVLMLVKDTVHAIFVRSCGTQGGPVRRVFSLRDHTTSDCDTILFISDLRFDLGSHTVICDGYVLPLTLAILEQNKEAFFRLLQCTEMTNVVVYDGEMQAWKQILPALAERCRSSWRHGVNCEYVSQGRIPLTEDMEFDPLCSCGRGKDVEGMRKVALWKAFAPYVTRVALSPLFAVSYLETVGREPDANKCSVCRGWGKPRLKACTGCMKVRYCSTECQKKDWKSHKPKCKA